MESHFLGISPTDMYLLTSVKFGSLPACKVSWSCFRNLESILPSLSGEGSGLWLWEGLLLLCGLLPFDQKRKVSQHHSVIPWYDVVMRIILRIHM